MLYSKIIGIIFITAFLFVGCGLIGQPESQPDVYSHPNPDTMKLTSPEFLHGGNIPSEYTCDGTGKSPHLQISGVPEDAKSLVLLMDDPDAVKPSGKVWDHWVVWNISPSTTDIPAGQEPGGMSGSGTNGKTGYHGPCPPDAEHRYYFKLYALDTELNLPEGSTKAEVEKAMSGHITERAELMGRYNRK